MNTRSFIFFTRILAQAQISSLIFRGLFYWGFIGHNFGDYKNIVASVYMVSVVLSVTILETTKTMILAVAAPTLFYRSQFWRLQKRFKLDGDRAKGFIGHNFGDYKNSSVICHKLFRVLSVTILETTKTQFNLFERRTAFYRSQFWRLQKQENIDKL